MCKDFSSLLEGKFLPLLLVISAHCVAVNLLNEARGKRQLSVLAYSVLSVRNLTNLLNSRTILCWLFPFIGSILMNIFFSLHDILSKLYLILQLIPPDFTSIVLSLYIQSFDIT